MGCRDCYIYFAPELWCFGNRTNIYVDNSLLKTILQGLSEDKHHYKIRIPRSKFEEAIAM